MANAAGSVWNDSLIMNGSIVILRINVRKRGKRKRSWQYLILYSLLSMSVTLIMIPNLVSLTLSTPELINYKVTGNE
jgi:hypothetical protein